MPTIRVQTEDFDLGAEVDALRAGNAKIGGIALFVGLVRDINDGAGVSTLTLEHYPAMTQKALVDIVDQACARWDVINATVIHRVGQLMPTDQIVLVIVASGHRGDAFQACEFIIDFLKTRAPFWKKESTQKGERWVEARASDDAASSRWQALHKSEES
ncbi:MAG: molybdopterin synthase catalytic subunit MoaE [Burkholderiales bacterium]|nr:molybdopterin synthase catalytic subunit MoaE [Burkholderiales bacterium]